jgi:hypothetical protein
MTAAPSSALIVREGEMARLDGEAGQDKINGGSGAGICEDGPGDDAVVNCENV